MASKPIVVGELVTTPWLNALWISVFDVTLTGTAASIDTGAVLPTSYAKLRIEIQARGDTANNATNLLMRINGDSGTNYYTQVLSGSAAAAVASENLGGTSAIVGVIAANTAGASLAGHSIIDIYNYGNTTFNKTATCSCDNMIGTATTNITAFRLGAHWRSTAAINHVNVFPAAGNFVSGTRLTIWAGGA